MGHDLSEKRPSTGSALNPVQELVNAITHTASKISLTARTNPNEYLPPGRLEAVIVMIHWPAKPILLGGDMAMAFGAHGEYAILSMADPTVIRHSGNIFEDAVENLCRGESYIHQPTEFIAQLTGINTRGQALFELTNETLGVIPSRWTWKDLQGGQ
jgi:hypothetical protein